MNMAQDSSKTLTTDQQQSYDYLFKLLIIGDQRTGKSCLLRRFVQDGFSEDYVSTIGIDFMFKVVTLAGNTVKLQIWDTAGQEQFRNITNAYYRGAAGVIVMFDVAERTTFTNIESWLDAVSRNCTETTIAVLVGNKTDLTERQVSHEEAQSMAEKHGITYVEVSVRDNSNVNEPFMQLTKKFLQSKGTSTPWWKN